MGKPITFEDDRVYRILMLISMAFGQGAGTMRATPDAVDAATADYRRLIEQSTEPWEVIELSTLELARSVGRFAAHVATADGRDVIEKRHYVEARRKLRPTIRCSFCDKLALEPDDLPRPVGG
jgi:hypothetical protein